MNPEFAPISDPDGVRISDPIENAQFEVYLGTAPDLEPAETAEFAFPVDAAVRTVTDELSIPSLVDVYVRTLDGRLVGETANRESGTYDAGAYCLELSDVQMKLYVLVEGAVTISRRDTSTVVSLSAPSECALGVRSFHEQPAGTIRVTDDLEGAATALSHLGSSLKTLSCERSFPTLRGHPPLVEVGADTEIPPEISPPDSGVTLELPPDEALLFEASSLAYYLGATVEIGGGPRLDLGHTAYDLPRETFTERVAELLKQFFFLDCVTRTEGFYPVDLHERAAVEERLDLDFAALYDRPLPEQLDRYMTVSYDAVAAHVPDWKLTTDVAADLDALAVLPYTANDLSVVRAQRPAREPTVVEEPDALTSFYRGPRPDGGRTADAGAGQATRGIVRPPDADSLEHAWVGDGFPIGASKVTARSLRRRLVATRPQSTSISVDIVCNDAEMRDEQSVGRVYGARDYLEFDVTVHENLTRSDLAGLLEGDVDFLHYVGHVDDRGFECADGMLDATTLDGCGVKAFLLNACRSYEQGEALVDAGAYGGIVTLAKVSNAPAVRIGRALARLLNQGFSLQSALGVARNVTTLGNQYITLGDGNLQVVRVESGVPMVTVVEGRRDDGRYAVTIHAYPTSGNDIGALVTPYVPGNSTKYINPGRLDRFELTREEFREYLQIGAVPLLVDGALTWSDEVDVADL